LKRNHDVIIIGAGPSGATLACELAGRGVDVLVLDKARFPRYKCCGGGLTIKASRLLDDGAIAVVENKISGVALGYGGAGDNHRDADRTIMYTVSRDKFDNYLVGRAEKAGATIMQGLAAEQVKPGPECVEVTTDAGNFQSRFVVGADGSRGIVAKSMNYRAPEDIVAIETEVLVDDNDLAKWKSRVVLDLGYISNGYGWLFPKADHLSIGIACLRAKAVGLKRSHSLFLESLGLGSHTIARWSADFIPLCGGQPAVTHDRTILLGDAAGLADPLTGEGIYHAVLSARLAAPAIEHALQCGREALYEYQQAVDGQIVPEIRVSGFFSKILCLMPQRLFNLVQGDDRIWRAGCALLRGETSYTAIKDRITSLGGIASLLIHR
jgi:geranylgeranyl reductase family protein